MSTPLLEVDHVDFSYGPLQVLFDVSIEVPVGGRVALLGTNGAGKSTLLRLVSGLARPDGGTVRFDGDDVTSVPASARVGLGIVQVNGGRATFPSLSVLENLRMGGYRFLSDSATVASRIDEVLDTFPSLRTRLSQPAGSLSGGEQQMIALGRAMVAGPRLLVIDELSLGLAPVVVQDILALVDSLAARGVTLLVVEQSLNVACAICDQAYFMEKGTVRFSGATTDLLERDDLVRSVFFGAGIEESA
ncbi:MAG TPA: ABC transporter ATP-binding protein [Acidimicrobiales bacterium]|nr:ABC transporter ATP-binding protein [Acidimicrobiales bacterium]